MPFISDNELSRLQTFVQNQKEKIKRMNVRQKAEEKADQLKSTFECVGAAAAIGFLRGKREDAAGVWNAPFLKFDIELLTGTAFVGAALFDLFGKYTGDALNVGNGILSHYGGQVARKFAKTGTFSQVAGSRVGALPQYDPTSFRATQYGSPHADPVAAALAEAGI